jgi:Protein of unknown function (DUF2442)
MAYHRNVLSLPPRLVEAKVLAGYEVYLRFADGLAADVDLSYLLDFGGVFEPLREVEFFRELTIDDGGNTVCWPNEADIAPETLYDRVQRAQYEKRRALTS